MKYTDILRDVCVFFYVKNVESALHYGNAVVLYMHKEQEMTTRERQSIFPISGEADD